MLQKRLFSSGKVGTNSEAEKIEIIYTRMLEGVTNYVPCEALRIRDTTYEIISNKDIDLESDATCIWEFFPGDKVKAMNKKEIVFPFGGGVFIPADASECEDCEEKTILLATELISSTFPNRKLYQLIFLIVSSLGEISLDQLQGFENEIKRLCVDSIIAQRRHPVIKKWLNKNCPAVLRL